MRENNNRNGNEFDVNVSIKRVQQMELYFEILTKTAEDNPEAFLEDD